MNNIKKTSLAITAILAVCGYANAENIRPATLHKGDTIAIISPASSPKKTDVDAAYNVLKEWGFVPVLGKYAKGEYGTFAGTIEQRLEDLRWACESPNIKAIMCGRGGYGSVQVLCELPDDYLAKHPKWIMGYSDITAMHGASVRSGVMSIHSNMCAPLGKGKGIDPRSLMLRSILQGDLPTYTLPCDSLNQTGEAKGTLIGGNLAVLNNIVNSPYDMLTIDNAILFIEDVHESLERLNRAMYHLKCSGVLSRIKGLIVGNFTGARPNPDFNNVNEMIHSVMKAYDIPVCYNFPVGHVEENYPLIEGAPVTLSVTPTGVTLKYDM